MNLLRAAFQLLKDTVGNFFRNRAAMYAAGLAYYTILALAPLLILVIAFAGFFIGRSTASEQIILRLQYLVGPQLSGFLEEIIVAINDQANGSALTAISAVGLLFGASGIFNQLKTALNSLWDIVSDRPEGWREWLLLVRSRTIPFLMIALLGLLLSMAVILETLVSMVQARFEVLFPEAALLGPAINFFLVPVLTFVTFTLVYKVLPDARTRWRDIYFGALLATLLFLLGRYALFGLLVPGSAGSVYGAAGSLLALLVWVYYSAIILLLGAVFTKAYADRFGQPIRPNDISRFEGALTVSGWSSPTGVQPDDRVV